MSTVSPKDQHFLVAARAEGVALRLPSDESEPRCHLACHLLCLLSQQRREVRLDASECERLQKHKSSTSPHVLTHGVSLSKLTSGNDALRCM